MNLSKVYGEPPWFLVNLQHNAKYPFLFRVVGQYVWIEVACWVTKSSAKKGWEVKLTRAGLTRFINPLFGCCCAIYLTPSRRANE